MATFDECFATQATRLEIPRDWESYWKKQITRLKKVPFEIETKRKVSKKLLTETSLSVNYQGAEKVRLQGTFLAPKKFRKKPPVVIVFPDYHDEVAVYPVLMNNGIAQFSIRLRGHEKSLAPAPADADGVKEESFGYFAENLLQKDQYYLNRLFLDAYRTVEVIRLRREVDASRIGLWGKGVGAAMALFVSKFMKRPTSLFLEHPSFMYLDLTQNLSKSKYTAEINQYIRAHRKQSSQVKANLRYFDGLNFCHTVNVPTAVVVNLKNMRSVPQGGFAMFHRIPADKEMHLFTAEDDSSLKDEKKKTIQAAARFFKRTL